MRANTLTIITYTLILFIGTSPLFGASRTCDPCACPESSCCPPPDPCAKCAQIWPCRGPDWIITPNGGPCVACGMDVHITAEFLYWTAREDQLTFVLKESLEMIESQTSVASQGHASQPDWQFDPGFKVGLGILYDHDGWDIYANYTWFRVCTSKKKVSADENERLTIKPLITIDNPSSVTAQWRLEFNTVDLELGRNFFISRCLKLRPHVGLKGTWQKQDYPIETVGRTAMDRDFSFTNEMDYWGVGLRAGLDTSWHWSRCISVFGDIAVSALWQGYDVDTKVVAEPPRTVAIDFTSNCHVVNPVVELLLGLRWETWFCCELYHFSAEGGWEIQWWNDQNRFSNFYPGDLLGDLFLQGLTLKFRLDF
ncbi:MAG: hypothetical protein KR126chlam1_00449 [Chlamydiae bacterium]|nr:hypothetical protein [Chlamydiota bacterium]